LDPNQAAGLVANPVPMMLRVFKGLDPSNPVYNDLADIPAGAMAQLLAKGKPSSMPNKLGSIYFNAGTTHDLPTSERLLHGLIRGKGLEDQFQGVKAKKGDYESYYAPGYASGQEPMSMSGAMGAMSPLLDAVLYGMPTGMQDKYSSWGDYLVNKWASRAMKKPAGKGPPVYRYVGRRLFR